MEEGVVVGDDNKKSCLVRLRYGVVKRRSGQFKPNYTFSPELRKTKSLEELREELRAITAQTGKGSFYSTRNSGR